MADNGNNNGHLNGYAPGATFGPEADELDEEEKIAYMRLSGEEEKDGSVVSMGASVMGVLARTINFPSSDLNAALALGDIENYDERDDLIAAIQERKLVGASMEPIMVYLAASMGTSKKGRLNNRVAQFYATMSHQRNMPTARPQNGKGSRTPLSD